MLKVYSMFLRWLVNWVELAVILISILTLGFCRPWWDFRTLARVNKHIIGLKQSRKRTSGKVFGDVKNRGILEEEDKTSIKLLAGIGFLLALSTLIFLA